MQMLMSGIVDGKRPLSTVCDFMDYEGLISVFENYRSTSDLKTVVDFRAGSPDRSADLRHTT
jgi:threonine 3-dehydrogenase